MECITPTLIHNVNYGFWILDIGYQWRFIDYNKCTDLDIDSGGGCACVLTDGIWEISTFFTQSCCEPKTAL